MHKGVPKIFVHNGLNWKHPTGHSWELDELLHPHHGLHSSSEKARIHAKDESYRPIVSEQSQPQREQILLLHSSRTEQTTL